MPENSEKGMDMAGREREKTNMLLLSGQSASPHAKKHLGKKQLKGSKSCWIAAAPEGSPECGDCGPSQKMRKGKGKVVQRTLNSRRRKSCLLNVTLC